MSSFRSVVLSSFRSVVLLCARFHLNVVFSFCRLGARDRTKQRHFKVLKFRIGAHNKTTGRQDDRTTERKDDTWRKPRAVLLKCRLVVLSFCRLPARMRISIGQVYNPDMSVEYQGIRGQDVRHHNYLVLLYSLCIYLSIKIPTFIFYIMKYDFNRTNNQWLSW